MDDPLKKFIDSNRDDFDHLDPSSHIFSKIKQELKSNLIAERKLLPRLSFKQIWPAAAVLFVIFSGYLLIFKTMTKLKPTQEQAMSIEPLRNQRLGIKEEVKLPVADASGDFLHKVTKTQKLSRVVKQEKNYSNMATIYTDLTDSLSSSTRLAAILKLKNNGIMNYDIIDKLVKTLNGDGSSNVRLASLDLMSSYSSDTYVSNALLDDLSTQNDPFTQLGIIEVLRNTETSKLQGKLTALLADPQTFEAVKDVAYLVLLKQNKL